MHQADVTTELARATALIGGGDVSRDRLISEWAASSDPLTRCVLAHHIADLSPDAADELAWDERALADADTAPHSSVAPFYPSLHLNLAASHLRLGDLPAARRHLDRAEATRSALGDDPYSVMIGAAVDRLRARTQAP
ncbi:hypothetical protein [Micromonospora sp. NPDC049240]|uniref:hypothetical protein n=1 Tax=Micromonospora sp. NPDC049240 TaxID=3155151 RepID=UPI0033CAC97C